MHEKQKLEEAKYFYSRMIEEQKNREHFKYNLSAFLSSARSVLQYALKEAEGKTGGRKWYRNQMSTSEVLKFFKNKRDFEVHEEPIKLPADYRVKISDSIGISGSLSIVVRDKDGKVKGQYSSEEPQRRPRISEPTVVTGVRYRFADWTGNEDVLALSEVYIKGLEDVVKDGVQKGFISG